jgi:PleD family two-component response regulator|tara:strand:- start:833 stop:976 length:144 start_codon:yes stop_codon:yes gene_type:complete
MDEKIKVLVIDDEESFCRYVEMFLQKLGYGQHSVHNGLDAVEQCSSF